MGLSCSSVGKEYTQNAGDPGLIPEAGRSPGEGKSYPLQYSGLENSMGCIVHGVTKSQTWLSEFHFYFFQWKWGVEIHLFFQELVSCVYLFWAALDLRCYTREFSGCGEWKAALLLQGAGFSCSGFTCWGPWALGTRGSVGVAHKLSCLQHVGSSRIRAWTCAPCIGQQILNHWTAKEVHQELFI